MAREKDVRTDTNTAGHITEALKLQTQYGYDFAQRHLLALGVDPALAIRLLSIRYERRAAVRPAQPGLDHHA